MEPEREKAPPFDNLRTAHARLRARLADDLSYKEPSPRTIPTSRVASLTKPAATRPDVNRSKRASTPRRVDERIIISQLRATRVPENTALVPVLDSPLSVRMVDASNKHHVKVRIVVGFLMLAILVKVVLGRKPDGESSFMAE
jgi:hypothetical protein